MSNQKNLKFNSQSRDGLYTYNVTILRTGFQARLKIIPSNNKYTMILSEQYLSRRKSDRNYTMDIFNNGDLVVEGDKEGIKEGIKDLASLLRRFDDFTSEAGKESWKGAQEILTKIKYGAKIS